MIWFDIIFALLLGPLIVGVTVWSMTQLSPESDQATIIRAERAWFVQGLLAPFLLWTVMNVGVSFYFHAFMPAVQAAQNANEPWFTLFLQATSGGLLVICSYWAAITLVWWLLRVYRHIRPDLDLEFRTVCFTSTVIMIGPALALLYFAGWSQIGVAVLLVTVPMVSYGAPILQRPKPRPMYARALARLKRGQYSDAEKEILRQLEKSENDFEGWLMLAELHAVRFKELNEAEQIILDTCLQAEATPSQISVALNKLADWQINITADPEAAARSLKLISDRLPGTHLAAMADSRRAQLPTNHEFMEQREARPIPVPAVPSMFAITEATAPPTTDPAKALAQIQQLTEALTHNPNLIAEREQLARLYAEPLGNIDRAIEQIELLLGIGNQPDAKCAAWLTLIAGWQFQLLHDETAATATLTRLIENYPSTPQAFAAQRRVSLLKAEAAARRI